MLENWRTWEMLPGRGTLTTQSDGRHLKMTIMVMRTFTQIFSPTAAVTSALIIGILSSMIIAMKAMEIGWDLNHPLSKTKTLFGLQGMALLCLVRMQSKYQYFVYSERWICMFNAEAIYLCFYWKCSWLWIVERRTLFFFCCMDFD